MSELNILPGGFGKNKQTNTTHVRAEKKERKKKKKQFEAKALLEIR